MAIDKELAEFGIRSFRETGGVQRVVDFSDEALVDLGLARPRTSVDREALESRFPDGLSVIRPLLRRSLRRRPGAFNAPQDGDTTWAGVVMDSPAGQSFDTVVGNWHVPTVWVPTTGQDPWWASAWVGIDGYGGSDVLQAGTDQEFTYGAAHYSCWYEWFPDYSITITNLPVKPGTAMTVMVTAISPTQARLFMSADGQAVSLSFDAPNGTRLVGNTAEWIVERPTDAATDTPYSVPDFTDVTFIGAAAGTPASAITVTQIDAFRVQMVEDGVVSAQATISTPGTLTVRYTPPPSPPGCASLKAHVSALQKELAAAPSSAKPQIEEQIAQLMMQMRTLGC